MLFGGNWRADRVSSCHGPEGFGMRLLTFVDQGYDKVVWSCQGKPMMSLISEQSSNLAAEYVTSCRRDSSWL